MSEYYHQPDDFIPERFDEANGGVKAFYNKGVLIPFGDGPRFVKIDKIRQIIKYFFHTTEFAWEEISL